MVFKFAKFSKTQLLCDWVFTFSSLRFGRDDKVRVTLDFKPWFWCFDFLFDNPVFDGCFFRISVYGMGLKGSGLEFTESGYLRGCGHCCEEEILWDWAAMGASWE